MELYRPLSRALLFLGLFPRVSPWAIIYRPFRARSTLTQQNYQIMLADGHFFGFCQIQVDCRIRFRSEMLSFRSPEHVNLTETPFTIPPKRIIDTPKHNNVLLNDVYHRLSV